MSKRSELMVDMVTVYKFLSRLSSGPATQERNEAEFLRRKLSKRLDDIEKLERSSVATQEKGVK
jgi:hypothetical protein